MSPSILPCEERGPCFVMSIRWISDFHKVCCIQIFLTMSFFVPNQSDQCALVGCKQLRLASALTLSISPSFSCVGSSTFRIDLAAHAGQTQRAFQLLQCQHPPVTFAVQISGHTRLYILGNSSSAKLACIRVATPQFSKCNDS